MCAAGKELFRMKLNDMTTIAVMAALICIVGPLTVAIGPVPLSLATFAIYMAGAILGKKRGCAATALYLVIGLIGVPVFSGFSGGFQKLAGPTGGYLLGYLPCAWFAGLGAELSGGGKRGKESLPVCMVFGTVLLYALGTVWFMIQSGTQLGGALSLCVLPFLPGDAFKIVAACLLTAPVTKAVRQR